MEVALEKLHDSGIDQSSKGILKEYLQEAKKNNQGFFIFRYPDQQISIAIHNTHSENSLEFVPFHSGKSIRISGIEFIHLNELYRYIPIPISSNSHYKPNQSFGIANKLEFEKMVEAARRKIKQGEIQKVVLSKIKKVSTSVSPIDAFQKLELKFPKAFVYIFYHPSSGLWVGASPEKLLEKKDNGTFHIHSLAGTKNKNDDWTEKEMIEQRLVTEDILNKLERVGISQKMVEGPFDLEYGSIKHLKTRISFQSSLPPNTILQSFHPTPAICGIPTDKARQLINDLEDYDRSYYTGYFGLTMSPKKLKTYFVNLRCMQFKDDNCYIYTGAGIVADSVPIDEWNEVEAKAQTLIDCIQNNA